MPLFPDRSAVFRSGLWTLHFGGLIVAAFWLTWWMLTPLDFGYRAAYRLLDIDAHIQEFSPQNIYRQGYEKTTEQQRFSHFTAIVKAINADGKGLAKITYENGESPAPTLLREPEVVHLQDVAELVSGFHVAGPLMCLLWLGTAALAKRLRWPQPPARQLVKGTLTLLIMGGALMLAVGPTAVFYWLHTHIFPENHQWFFYYQESLMTTLMKAPDLFGFIAVLWAALGMAIIAIAMLLERRLLKAAQQ